MEKYKMNKLVLEERESHLNMTGDDRTKWEFFTDDPFWIRKMKTLGIQPIKSVGEGFIYTIPASQVTIRKERKKLTKEKKEVITKRLSKK